MPRAFSAFIFYFFVFYSFSSADVSLSSASSVSFSSSASLFSPVKELSAEVFVHVGTLFHGFRVIEI